MRAAAAEYLIRQRVSALRRVLPAAKAGDVTSLHHASIRTLVVLLRDDGRHCLGFAEPSRRRRRTAACALNSRDEDRKP